MIKTNLLIPQTPHTLHTMNNISEQSPSFNTRQHPITIAISLAKAFVKISLFAALYVLIDNTANIDTPLLLTLPRTLQAMLIAALSWIIIAPLIHDLFLYLSYKIIVSHESLTCSQGLIFPQSFSIPREAIKNVTVIPSPLGKKIGYANLTVTHKKSLSLNHIRDPINLQFAIINGTPPQQS
jgi:membrane protein YdbS with pleckstrin-like domain